jgi:hypothetical protein
LITTDSDTICELKALAITNSIDLPAAINAIGLQVSKPGYKSVTYQMNEDSLVKYESQPLIIILEKQAEFGEQGLVAYYTFNGNANDMSDYNNDGIAFNIVSVADRKGNPESAFLFNGENAYVSVPSSSSLNPDDQLTMNLWIKISAFTNRYTPVIHKGGPYKDCFTNREYLIYLEDTHQIYAESSGDNSCHRGLYAYIPVMNEWFMYTMVIDRKNHLMKSYINGEFQYEGEDDYSSFTHNNDSLKIGTWDEVNSSYAPYFSGCMDDLRIYNIALTDQEISDLFYE